MTVHPDVQMHVERIARKGTTDFYESVAPLAGLDLGNAADRNTLSEMLGEISKRSYRAKQVLVSAVIVTKPPSGTGFPGGGFFDLARDLGVHTGQGQSADEAFWANEVKRVHAAYR